MVEAVFPFMVVMAQPSDPSNPSRPAGAPNPYAAPASDFATPPPVPASPAKSRGPQIAGAFMLLGATATLISVSSGQGGGGVTFGSVIVDVLLGVSLVSNKLQWRNIAAVRVVVGAVIFGGKDLIGDNVLEGVFQLAYAVPFLLLLLGTPGKARTIVGGVMGGLMFVLIYVALAH
jgi:hypothetical protein